MSWKHPRYRLKDSGVLGVDDINENVWGYVEEVNGNLNEQNFAADGFTRSSIADDAGIRLWHDSDDVEGDDSSASPASTITIPNSAGWSNAGSSKQFTGGGTLWISASLQYSGAYPGCLFGLKVDGNLLEWSVVGSTDSEQEVVGPDSIGGAGYLSGAGYTTPAPQWEYHPIVLEAVVPVPHGVHNVEVVASVLSGPYGASGNEFKVFGRELIIVELRR